MNKDEKKNEQKRPSDSKEVRSLREDLDDDIIYLDDDDIEDPEEIIEEPDEETASDIEYSEEESEECEEDSEKYEASDEEEDDEAEEEEEEYEYTDPENEDLMEEERAEKRRKAGKVFAIAGGSVLGILLVVYLGLAAFFHSHYYFFTEINGTDFSGKTVKAVEQYMSNQVKGYQLTLNKIDGTQEFISGADISLEYQPGEELQKYMEKQNPFLWPQAFWKRDKVQATIGVKYNETALAEKLAALECMKPENQTPSASAAPVFDGTEYQIQPETIGTQINAEVLNSAVADSISQFKSEINLKESGCYQLPPFTQDSAEVAAARDTMNQYVNASVTYDLNPATEIVDRAVISQWLSVDENMNVVLNAEAIGTYVADLAGRYDTVGTTRTITTPSGKTANVSGGSYGWKIDQAGEIAALSANIQNGDQVTREPVYAQKAVAHSVNDWGNTFIEVDLSAQYMWYLQDGNVVFEASVVTGKPDPKHETPAGIFSILEKMRNKVLRGEKKEDGTYEYETPVSYWMRVTWTGIGFHDATWQSSFGGTRYRDGYGSHGCINMTYNGAATLYDLVYVGVPVIIHY
ncbi:MAG TPA: hypothetical protein DCZ20_01870 [Lachnospiraceae bacterium]|nr:hypothetical protein [Lachnospiraceae bacterium]